MEPLEVCPTSGGQFKPGAIQDMNKTRLYIAIFGSQLYVYLFPPETTKESDGSRTTTADLSPARIPGQSYQETLLNSAHAKKYQIDPSPL